MPEKFENKNQNENQPEEEKIEKLEDMDFDRRVVEINQTLSKLQSALNGEKLVQKGETKTPKGLTMQDQQIEDYEQIRGSITAKEYTELKEIEREENLDWLYAAAHNLNSFNTIILNQIADENWDKDKKHYLYRRKKVEKLLSECQFWPELNRAYEILFPFLSQERPFYKKDD